MQAVAMRLLRMGRMQAPTHNELRRVLDTVHECLGLMQAYFDTKRWEPLIVYLIVDCMDRQCYK